jgi:hypothetical protein
LTARNKKGFPANAGPDFSWSKKVIAKILCSGDKPGQKVICASGGVAVFT